MISLSIYPGLISSNTYICALSSFNSWVIRKTPIQGNTGPRQSVCRARRSLIQVDQRKYTQCMRTYTPPSSTPSLRVVAENSNNKHSTGKERDNERDRLTNDGKQELLTHYCLASLNLGRYAFQAISRSHALVVSALTVVFLGALPRHLRHPTCLLLPHVSS